MSSLSLSLRQPDWLLSSRLPFRSASHSTVVQLAGEQNATKTQHKNLQLLCVDASVIAATRTSGLRHGVSRSDSHRQLDSLTKNKRYLNEPRRGQPMCSRSHHNRTPVFIIGSSRLEADQNSSYRDSLCRGPSRRPASHPLTSPPPRGSPPNHSGPSAALQTTAPQSH